MATKEKITTRTVRVCDRCDRTIRGEGATELVHITGPAAVSKTYELCGKCTVRFGVWVTLAARRGADGDAES